VEDAEAIKIVYQSGGVSCNYASRGAYTHWGWCVSLNDIIVRLTVRLTVRCKMFSDSGTDQVRTRQRVH
jgi:hypothetical protein